MLSKHHIIIIIIIIVEDDVDVMVYDGAFILKGVRCRRDHVNGRSGDRAARERD